jgi:hypothetical protein
MFSPWNPALFLSLFYGFPLPPNTPV